MLRRQTSPVETLCMPNHRLPLGALRLGGYQVLEIEMEPGDILLAYSDGVAEAQSPSGDFFGEGRLAEVLEAAPVSSPQATVNHIIEEIEAFTCGHTPYDDLTLLAAKRIDG